MKPIAIFFLIFGLNIHFAIQYGNAGLIKCGTDQAVFNSVLGELCRNDCISDLVIFQ